jgi:hypothetical protein
MGGLERAPQAPHALGTARRSRAAPRSRAGLGSPHTAPYTLGTIPPSRAAPRSRAGLGSPHTAPYTLGTIPPSRAAPRSGAGCGHFAAAISQSFVLGVTATTAYLPSFTWVRMMLQ